MIFPFRVTEIALLLQFTELKGKRHALWHLASLDFKGYNKSIRDAHLYLVAVKQEPTEHVAVYYKNTHLFVAMFVKIKSYTLYCNCFSRIWQLLLSSFRILSRSSCRTSTSGTRAIPRI